jgi:hypothetical protein
VDIRLTHSFLRGCIDPKALLLKCFKFSTFARRLESQATAKAIRSDGTVNKKIENKYKGDGFELFVEAFIRVFGSDMLIQIEPSSYEVINCDDDYGVDGVGLGENGKPHTVQNKFRAANYTLDANDDNLTNFTSLSMLSSEDGGFGVDPNDKYNMKNGKIVKRGRKRVTGKCNMTIIHCGKEIHYKVMESMMPTVREINRTDIRNKVDDNNIFWNTFKESWERMLANG